MVRVIDVYESNYGLGRVTWLRRLWWWMRRRVFRQQRAETPRGPIFQAPDGVYQLDGVTARKISEDEGENDYQLYAVMARDGELGIAERPKGRH